ncbi:MAG: radical SAM protein [Spirochaetes bacterium]|nr:radical SAM protein [Spirochaetota bacterium]
MAPSIALFTPPFLQPNGPYAATPFLAAGLAARGLSVRQYDVSLTTLLRFFSPAGLERFFDAVAHRPPTNRPQKAMLERRDEYVKTIGPTIAFLQGANPTLAHRILTRDYLPEGERFRQIEGLFNLLERGDGALHLAALYLDDLHDLAVGTVLPGFGFSRYREKLAGAAPSYDGIQEALDGEPDLVDRWLGEAIAECPLDEVTLAGITVPFPGNLMGALLTARHLKRLRPGIQVALGGGWVSTELRSLEDPRIFDLVDFISLDEGEGPLAALAEHVEGKRPRKDLVRTMAREDGKVVWFDGTEPPSPCAVDPTPSYEGLHLGRYFTVLESVNPVMRLWAERGFGKLRAARGCYHKKCTFCDTSLPYISDYRPLDAVALLGQAETLARATGLRGIHFVDEAMPAGLMQRFGLLARERLPDLVWWGNVRFDRSFTPTVCRAMKQGGCVAVSGGLEGLVDSVLARMKKGVALAPMIKSLQAFRDSGILVHAYLIHAFPGSTVKETVDALEVLRQLFQEDLLGSAFWHRFALTVHSPVFASPESYGLYGVSVPPGGFARNEARYEEEGIEAVDLLGDGLRKATYNFMHGVGLREDVRSWFDFPVPKAGVGRTWVAGVLKS